MLFLFVSIGLVVVHLRNACPRKIICLSLGLAFAHLANINVTTLANLGCSPKVFYFLHLTACSLVFLSTKEVKEVKGPEANGSRISDRAMTGRGSSRNPWKAEGSPRFTCPC